MLDIMDASLYNTIYYSWVHEAQAVRRPARTHNIYMQWDKEPPPPEDAANSLLGFRTTHTALCSVFRVHAVLPATLRRPACQRATISVRRIFFILYFLPPFFSLNMHNGTYANTVCISAALFSSCFFFLLLFTSTTKQQPTSELLLAQALCSCCYVHCCCF